MKFSSSFKFLNITQFLGALNDNIFKLLIIFLLIHLRGQEKASVILSLAGAVYVIPFLLFSAAAGVLADRLSKRLILVMMKLAEMIIMILSVLAIFFKLEITIFILLFFMAAQSSMFGPSKYGIIPEIVSKNKIAKANGILTSLTFLAIIIGTFLASLITDVTDKNFVLASLFCVLIAVIGFLSSLKIEKTVPKKSKKKISVLFLYQIYKTLKLSYKRRYLLPSIFGASFFLFIGGFVQLNTIPFAIQSLGLSEIGGGYLFLSTALGITLGALIAPKLSKGKIDLGLSCFSGFITSILLVFLGIFQNIWICIILLVSLGISGGMFLIPFESFLQARSPQKRRGQIIAASSFLSFFGVLIASGLLFLLNETLSFSAASSFICLGGIVFIFNFINTGRLSDYFISFILKNFSRVFYNIKIENLPSKNSLIFIEEKNLKIAFFLLSEIDNLKIISFKRLKIWSFFLHSIYSLSFKNLKFLKELFQKEKTSSFCLMTKKNVLYEKLKNISSRNIYVLKIKKEKSLYKMKFILCNQKA